MAVGAVNHRSRTVKSQWGKTTPEELNAIQERLNDPKEAARQEAVQKWYERELIKRVTCSKPTPRC